MEELSIKNWDNVLAEDIIIILEALATGDDSKLSVKHLSIMEIHEEKLEELIQKNK